jgi:hypothetical protein
MGKNVLKTATIINVRTERKKRERKNCENLIVKEEVGNGTRQEFEIKDGRSSRCVKSRGKGLNELKEMLYTQRCPMEMERISDWRNK